MRTGCDINATSTDLCAAASLVCCGSPASTNSLQPPLTGARASAGAVCGQQRGGDVLIDELVPVDETQALEEGQRDERVGVSDLDVARHSLDQSHEALQLRCDVIWGRGGGT